jgi:hypothetical protein
MENEPDFRAASDKHLSVIRTKAQTDQAKAKRKETFKNNKHQQGASNSNYGKKWLTNGVDNILVLCDDIDKWAASNFVPGRTM